MSIIASRLVVLTSSIFVCMPVPIPQRYGRHNGPRVWPEYKPADGIPSPSPAGMKAQIFSVVVDQVCAATDGGLRPMGSNGH